MIEKFKDLLLRNPQWLGDMTHEAWACVLTSRFPIEMKKWYDSSLTDIWAKDRNYYEIARKELVASAEFKVGCADADIIIWACALLARFFENEMCMAQRGKTTKKRKASKSGNRGGDGIAGVHALPPVEVLEEGAIVEMHIAKHERNAALRKACIEHYRAQHDGQVICEACGLSLGEMYGDIGEGYIEVHHLSPISQTEGTHAVDPTADLVPLCANCHAMIHRLMSAEKKATGNDLEGNASLQRLQVIIQERVAHA